MPSKVYFSDLRTSKKSLTDKLKNLMKAAGFETINFEGKYVAVKMHFGEPGNLAFLRPNWLRLYAAMVRHLGVSPFLPTATRFMSEAGKMA